MTALQKRIARKFEFFHMYECTLSHYLLSGTRPKTNGPTTCKELILAATNVPKSDVVFREGQGRVTIFASESNARTFDYQVHHE